MNRLIIPGTPPSMNHMYRNAMVKGRRMRVLSKTAKNWADDMTILATDWRVRNRWKTADGKVIVRFWFYFPNGRRRDTHNTLKLLLDCFEDARIYENDQLALPQIMDYDIDRDNPRVEVEFERLDAS